MAVLNPNIATADNEKDQQGQTGQGAVTPVINGGGGGFSGGSGQSTSGAPTTAGPAANSSGQWTNLQNYMSANKDFHQNTGGMGGDLANQIGQQKSSIDQNIGTVQNEFQNQAQASASPWSNYDATQSQQMLANPVQTLSNGDQSQQIKNWENAQYTGPQSFNDAQGSQTMQGVQGQIQSLQDMGNEAQSEGGRFNLLRQMFGGKNYTQGQQTLDNLLIQGDPNQAAALNNTRQYGAQAANNLNQAEQSTVGSTVDKYNTLAKNTRAGVNADVGNAFNTQQTADKKIFDTDLTGYNTDATSAKNYSNGTFNSVNKSIGSQLVGNAPSGSFQNYGVGTGGVGDTKMTDYLNAAPTQSSAVSKDQAAQWQALLALADQANVTADQRNFIDPSQAGSYTGSMNAQKYLNDVSAAKNNYTNVLLPTATNDYNAMLSKIPGWTENNLGQWINDGTGPNNGHGVDFLSGQSGLNGWMENALSSYGQTNQSINDILAAGNYQTLTGLNSPLATTRNYIGNDPFFGASGGRSLTNPSEANVNQALQDIMNMVNSGKNPHSTLNYS